eukprot:Colp12_sorted_trinity150504_noHs@29995
MATLLARVVPKAHAVKSTQKIIGSRWITSTHILSNKKETKKKGKEEAKVEEVVQHGPSSNTSANWVEYSHDFEYASELPRDHTAADLGKYFVIPKDDVSNVFSRGIGKSLDTEAQHFLQTSLMVRKPFLQVKKMLSTAVPAEATAPQYFIPRVLLDGHNGCGKTATLAHTVQHCHKEGWLVLYVPSVFQIIDHSMRIKPNPRDPTFYDQPDDSIALLNAFKKANEKHLSKHKLSKTDAHGLVSGKSTLLDLVNVGIRERGYAADAVHDLVQELRAIETQPVLVAIDQVNGLFSDSSLHDPEGKKLYAGRLQLVRYLRQFITERQPLKRGAAIFGVCRTTALVSKPFEHIPFSTSGTEGYLEAIKQGVKSENVSLAHEIYQATWVNKPAPEEDYEIFLKKLAEDEATKKSAATVSNLFKVNHTIAKLQVNPYTKEEVASCLKYYAHRGWLNVPDVDPKLVKEISVLTSSIPTKVWDYLVCV